MSNILCNGDGMCLIQTNSSNEYGKRENYTCTYDCQPIKCPNYLLCENLAPQCILWCHKGLCGANCNILFKGNLQFFEDKECPICLETTKCVKQMNCNHTICVGCFKRCHLPPYWNDPQPAFPYDSDIEDQYEEDMDDELWKNDPLIQKYEEDLMKWEVEREMREANESYLKVCSLCRE